MIRKIFKKSPGQIKKNTLILIGLIIVVLAIFGGIVYIMNRPPPPPEDGDEKPKGPVFEVIMDDIKFRLKEAKDLGNVLKASDLSEKYRIEEDLTTTEKFIEVTITAQNIGKEEIAGLWGVGALVDSEGRNFEPVNEAIPWIPEESKCASFLKPGFTPTPCIQIYEVAKIARDLKAAVSPMMESGKWGARDEPEYIDLAF